MGSRKKKARRAAEPEVQAPATPFNNPFAALQGIRGDLDSASARAAPPPPRPAAPRPAPPWGKIVVSAEKKGRKGKTVTRVSGLPAAEVKAAAGRLKVALGCGATFEDGDLLLLGSLVERVVPWLEAHGAARVVVSGGAGRAAARGTRRRVPARAALGPGQIVEIVLKKDQGSGTLTRGELQEILTRSATHPHGIKVRLVGGAVGRVQRLVDPGGTPRK